MQVKEWKDALSALGARVGERWAPRFPDENAFAEIASDELEAAGFEGGFDALTEALLSSDPLPKQINPDGTFGQPSVTAFRGDCFVIEVLYWLDGLVSIHQHGFSGAFGVLSGSSVHCRYRFREQSRVHAGMLLGRLELSSAEFLRPGQVRRIDSGPALIHSTFHLERPTVTLVVRTQAARENGPQYDYRPPSLAIDPFHRPPTLEKRLQILRMLARCRPALYFRSVRSLLEHTDLFAAYRILDQGFLLSEDVADRERLVALARAVHGDRLGPLVPVLEESAKRRALVAWRDRETDDEVRLLFALLLNVPDRRTVFELLSLRYPEETSERVVLRCLKKLGIDEPSLVLGRILLGGAPDRDELRARLARENVRYKNDFEMLASARALREAPGLERLFAAK